MHNSKRDTINAITDGIQEDLQISQRLLAILTKEKQATIDRDFAVLSVCLEEKAPLLDRLETHATQRSTWLQGLQPNHTENDWIKALKEIGKEELLPLWRELKKTVVHCQTLNTVNGKLIKRGVTVHDKLLSILRGKPNGSPYNNEGNNLYTRRGLKESPVGSAALIQV